MPWCGLGRSPWMREAGTAPVWSLAGIEGGTTPGRDTFHCSRALQASSSPASGTSRDLDKPVRYSRVNAPQQSWGCVGPAVFHSTRRSLEAGRELLPQPVSLRGSGLWPSTEEFLTQRELLQLPQVPPQLLYGCCKTRASLDPKKGFWRSLCCNFLLALEI